MATSVCSAVSPSIRSSLSVSGVPTPLSSFSASSAWNEPTTPAIAPSTPASRQPRRASGGGAVGNTHR